MSVARLAGQGELFGEVVEKPRRVSGSTHCKTCGDSSHKTRYHDHWERALALYRDGTHYLTILANVGISKPTLHAWLDQAGIPRNIRDTPNKCCSICGERGHDARRHNPDYRRGPEVHRCTICGGMGHNRTLHEEWGKTRYCPSCKHDLPIDQFKRKYAKPLPPGAAESLTAYCIECSSQKAAARYRSSFHERFGYRLAAIRHKCREKNIPCTITVEYLERLYEQQGGRCYFSGRPLSLETGDNAVSIDRLDPDGPYSDPNVALTLWVVNDMKKRTSEADFVALCRDIAAYWGTTHD